MSKLHKQIDNYNQENSVYLSYEKRWVEFSQVCTLINFDILIYILLSEPYKLCLGFLA